MIDKKHIGYAPPPILWDVEKGRIAFFAKVIGLTDPIHTDEAAAKAAGYRGIVAPPTFFFGAESDAGVSMKMIQEFEIDLGKVLPSGYTVLALGGDLTARMQADGALVVQAPPGEWEVWLAARAAGALSTLQVPALPEPWPQQEVLQFAGVPRFRIAQLEGLPAVDPEQVVEVLAGAG